ncbi:MAG: D-alanyl-D-alanine carboxypeptidase/D-alanyl-D-alanine-endopeptidase [Deltaproteobacteria bacterium]|nr:D-alanyl-D-alanine carboxypeptidase/D-alanyl-D-alanine-endopeptidase [Deltaproteobacteria bacterium]
MRASSLLLLLALLPPALAGAGEAAVPENGDKPEMSTPGGSGATAPASSAALGPSLTAAPSNAAITPELQAALANLPNLPIFAKSRSALDVIDAETGARVYSYGDDARLLPASTMKLVTSSVALRELGPSYRFPTWVKHDGDLGADGVLQGNLYVIGQGDPTMVVERMWRMVADIKARGVSEIQGDLVFDDSYTQDSVWVPGWNKPEDLEDGSSYYSALGALSLNYNIATINIRPGPEVGGAALAAFDTPSDVLVLDNQLTTGRDRSKYWVKVERTLDEKDGKVATYKLTGNVPADHEPDQVYRTLADPTGNYLSVFRDMVKANGIKLKGKARVGAAPVDSTLVLKVESDRLVEILMDMNKQSNNFMAEQVLRAVGAEKLGLPGSTEKGVKVMNDYMTSLGVPSERYKFVNGSGLSREATMSPSAMDAVLMDMWNDVDRGPEFLATLAVGGRDGTLWHRFREDGMEGRVRAKTGSLNGVFCLSGYVRAVDGRNYAFSFFVNDIDGNTVRARAAHDELVRALAGVNGNLAEAGDGGGD